MTIASITYAEHRMNTLRWEMPQQLTKEMLQQFTMGYASTVTEEMPQELTMATAPTQYSAHNTNTV